MQEKCINGFCQGSLVDLENWLWREGFTSAALVLTAGHCPFQGHSRISCARTFYKASFTVLTHLCHYQSKFSFLCEFIDFSVMSKCMPLALTGVAQCVGCCLARHRCWLVSVQGTHLGWGLSPWSECAREAANRYFSLALMFFSPFPPSFSSLLNKN